MLKSIKVKARGDEATAIIAAVPRLASACATCGLADGDQAFHAYKTSVLFMLVVAVRIVRRDRRDYLLVLSASIRRDRKSTTK